MLFFYMAIKTEILKLKEKIEQNIDFLMENYQATDNFFQDLSIMINLNLSDSYIVKWWFENEHHINTITHHLKEKYLL